jgi:hypothetical protein
METIVRLAYLAGLDYMWEGTKTYRLSSDPRAGLRVWMESVQSGKCAFCGGPLGIDWELCHIVSGGKEKRGWTPGNIAAGCNDCNDIDAKTHSVIPYGTINHPELIQTEWPPIPTLSRMGKAEKIEKENRKAEKRMRRGM